MRNASAENWLDEALHVEQTPSTEGPSDQTCEPQSITIQGHDTPRAVCITQKGKDFTVLSYAGNWYAQHGSDTTFYPLYRRVGDDSFTKYNGFIETDPDTNTTILRAIPIYGKLEIFKDLADRLALTQLGDERVYMMPFMSDFTLVNSKGQNETTTSNVGISHNGKYLAVKLINNTITRINLETLEQKSIGHMSANTTYRLAVSDSGRYVAGVGMPYEIVRVSNDCGMEHSDELVEADECPSRYYTDTLSQVLGSDVYRNANLFYPYNDIQFNAENSFTIARKVGADWQYITLSHDGPLIEPADPEVTRPPRLDYLALGDSYSSGEGDIGTKDDGSTFYLAGTEKKDQCHLSSRSYPFLLRSYYNISAKDMKSVACSGAQVSLDYMQPMATYHGQGRRLKDLSDQQLANRHGSALQTSEPGIVPQIEFVKKYRPKVVTLTGGGNDVGFADIVTYCASPEITDNAFIPLYTCDYAKPGSYLEKLLYDSIDSQYEVTTKLIGAIRAASPTTRIVLIDYPSFISSGDEFCSLSAATLNEKERIMINNGVSYMNKMLRRVATDTEISFVDVENSLAGGRICEGEEYITGVADLSYRKINDKEFAEAFHPNSAGHQKLADAIEQSDAMQIDTIPETNDYEPRFDSIGTYASALIPSGEVGRESRLASITMDPGSFQPGTTVTATLHSDPITLGAYTATEEGGLEAVINPSTLPVGQHLLILEGTDYNDDPVRYFQFITVTLATQNDAVDITTLPSSNQPDAQTLSCVTGCSSHTSNPSDRNPIFSNNAISLPIASQGSITTSPQAVSKKSHEDAANYSKGTGSIVGILAFLGILGTISGIIYIRWHQTHLNKKT